MSDFCNMVFDDGNSEDFMSVLIKGMEMPKNCSECPGGASWGFAGKCIAAIDDAPTIIEAEGEKE